MTTQKNAGAAAGRAAALPAASLAPELAALHDMAGATHYGMAHQVAPLLRAAENLADCHRTLRHVTFCAEQNPGFMQQLAGIDPAYMNHAAEYDGFELVQDLLRVAVNLLADHTERMEQMGSAIDGLKDRAAASNGAGARLKVEPSGHAGSTDRGQP